MKIEIINSKKFKNISDVIFSETTDYQDFLNKNISESLYTIEDKSLNGSRFVTYINKSFNISDGDIVFCQTDYVHYLFELLNNSDLNRIDLITHQSDMKITKKIYNQKPACINYWYSTNVTAENKKLIPIPIGINNDFYQAFPIEEDFISKKFKKSYEKLDRYYLNFNVNTNFYHRLRILKKYSYQLNSSISSRVNKEEYLEDLNQNKFIICPYGNGIDTHRVWEAIYANSYPVVQKSIAYKNFTDLPIIFVKNIATDDIDLNIVRDINLEKANFSYWHNKILSNKYIVQNIQEIPMSFNLDLFTAKEKKIRSRNSKNKRIKYFIFRVYKYFYLLIYRKTVI